MNAFDAFLMRIAYHSPKMPNGSNEEYQKKKIRANKSELQRRLMSEGSPKMIAMTIRR